MTDQGLRSTQREAVGLVLLFLIGLTFIVTECVGPNDCIDRWRRDVSRVVQCLIAGIKPTFTTCEPLPRLALTRAEIA